MLLNHFFLYSWRVHFPMTVFIYLITKYVLDCQPDFNLIRYFSSSATLKGPIKGTTFTCLYGRNFRPRAANDIFGRRLQMIFRPRAASSIFGQRTQMIIRPRAAIKFSAVGRNLHLDSARGCKTHSALGYILHFRPKAALNFRP